ncbi:MAG: hypothetical protein ABFS56_32175 [Pseudomonadota bacterium]
MALTLRSPFFYLTYFRLWFYPWHFLKSLVSISLTNNPYISDGAIWLPIWGMTRKLTTQAQDDPETGFNFSQVSKKRNLVLIQDKARCC